jgi:hypothetical protein
MSLAGLSEKHVEYVAAGMTRVTQKRLINVVGVCSGIRARVLARWQCRVSAVRHLVAHCCVVSIVTWHPTRPQFAIYANHQPRKKTNATLAWDTDWHYGRTPVGQPVLMLTKPVAPGDEVTVDYGPNFAYKKHVFRRDTSNAKRPRASASSTPSSAFLATPSVMTATTTFKSGHDLLW